MKIVFFLCVLFLLPSEIYSVPHYIETQSRKKSELKSKSVRIFGNRVLSEEKIKSIMGLGNKDIGKDDMEFLLRKLEKYYISEGYDLIDISYLFLMDEWYVFINEGRIGKIIIKGESAINTIFLKNAFVFRENTFNSGEIKNIIEGVRKNYGFKRIQYRLIPVEKERKSLFGFTEKVAEIIRRESADSYIEPEFDLLILIKKKDWGDGFGGFITYNSFGLVSGLSYSDSSLVTSNDRFRTVLKGGVNSRGNIDTNQQEIIFTLIALDLIYYPSVLRFRYFKPSIESVTSDISYQRADLSLNEYRLFSQDFSLFAGFELKKNMILSYGFGEEYVVTHSFDYTKKSDKNINEIRLLRSYLSLTFNYLISEPRLRTDFQENLKTRLRYYIPSDNQSHWLFSSDYTKTVLFGYDYMKIAAGFKSLTGDIPFFDEFSIAYSSFKSSFSDSYYARDAIYSGFEYDLSLYRDILHLGLFTDTTLFNYKNYMKGKMYWLGALDAGSGIRILFYDMFLLKADYAYAYAFNGKSDGLFLFSASKVF